MHREIIQTHQFEVSAESFIPFKYEELKYKNEYDDSQLHRHTYYEIFLFEQGGGTHTLDFINIPINNNCIHFVTPGQVHRVNRAINSNGCVMMFTDEFFYFNAQNKNLLFELPFFHNKSSNPTFAPETAEFNELKKLCADIKAVYEIPHSFKLNILQSYLHIFLLRCKQAYENVQAPDLRFDNASIKLIHSFKVLLEKNFTDQHMVNSYAKKLNVTPAYLNSICKNVAGKNASEIIKERILLESKRLLLFSNLNAKQIAFELNFEDPSHFSRFFKNHTNLSPQEFVKNQQAG